MPKRTGSEVSHIGGSGSAVPQHFARTLAVGAEVVSPGTGKPGVHFRVWAPGCSTVELELWSGAAKPRRIGLHAESQGYFAGLVPEAAAGMRYQYRLASGTFPDPASRFQPEGVNGPSEIIDPATFQWTDEGWPGVARTGQVIYEMHIGTFTSEGTWRAARGELAELAELGITMVELMPVSEFPGSFGWGYDGVDLFAPTRLYGRPEDFRAFVDHAHGLGMGVILDVVYNHFGPDGNYLKHFSTDYFTSKYENEWGEAINFDGPNSSGVREFFLANASYWIGEFHLDGLRFDATQQIFDGSTNHILGALSRRCRESGGTRSIYLVAENEVQEAGLLRPFEAGGFDFDAVWNDDFHHTARVAAAGRAEAYYSEYRGTPQEFISTAKRGFLYQGQYYRWQKKCRGTPTRGIPPAQFVNFLQNHDQVANSLDGLRLHELTSPGRYRALTAFLLLAPGTPMLFQGQEFGASSPFLYFADHKPELAKLVAVGRRGFLSQFPSIACPENQKALPSPHDHTTFAKCILDPAERRQHSFHYRLHRDLIQLRKHDPVVAKCECDGAVLGPEAFALRYFGPAGADRLVLVNLGTDLRLSPAPEPLLAPPESDELGPGNITSGRCASKGWALLWSSEWPQYGGRGAPALDTTDRWILHGQSAVVLGPERP